MISYFIPKVENYAENIHMKFYHVITVTLREHHGIPKHQQLDFLFTNWFRVASKTESMTSITGYLYVESTSDWWIPCTKYNYAECVSRSLCHRLNPPFHYTDSLLSSRGPHEITSLKYFSIFTYILHCSGYSQSSTPLHMHEQPSVFAKQEPHSFIVA